MTDLFPLLAFNCHFLCSSWTDWINRSVTGSKASASYSHRNCSAHIVWQSGCSLTASSSMPDTQRLVYLWLEQGHAAGWQWERLMAALHHGAPSCASSATPNCASHCGCEMFITNAAQQSKLALTSQPGGEAAVWDPLPPAFPFTSSSFQQIPSACLLA